MFSVSGERLCREGMEGKVWRERLLSRLVSREQVPVVSEQVLVSEAKMVEGWFPLSGNVKVEFSERERKVAAEEEQVASHDRTVIAEAGEEYIERGEKGRKERSYIWSSRDNKNIATWGRGIGDRGEIKDSGTVGPRK